jgi:ring-1,2-phenylacetyl-CoA epoxidase subunit PaaD
MNTWQEKILSILQEVKDPEIPVLSVVDMGIITQVDAENFGCAKVSMTPTFVGCPALEMMKNQIQQVLEHAGFERVEVNVDFETRWTSDRMSAEAKKKLETFGIAPPAEINEEVSMDALNRVRCPHCGSTDTTLNSPFGSTLCRAIRFCFHCKQGFEQFKPI